MKSVNWKSTIELIGIGAIIASLIFVGLQLRQEQEIAIVDTYGAVTETEINLSILVSQDMAIWHRGLEGEEQTVDEQAIFIGLLAAVASQYQRVFIRWIRLGPGNPDNVASEFAYALYVFPGMRRAYDANSAFNQFRDEARGFGVSMAPWDETVLRYLAKYDEEMPPIPVAKEYIFWAF
jgi:hypothetical protein